MTILTDQEIEILRRLLHRTWNVIGDDVWGTISRNGVWEISVDRASDEARTDVERLVLTKFYDLPWKKKEQLKKQIFTHNYYEGGR